jgi:hypothetical protein
MTEAQATPGRWVIINKFTGEIIDDTPGASTRLLQHAWEERANIHERREERLEGEQPEGAARGLPGEAGRQGGRDGGPPAGEDRRPRRQAQAG